MSTIQSPSLEQIAALAEKALLAFPPRLGCYLQDLTVKVEELPTAHTLVGLGIESVWDLTGLYKGTPLTDISLTTGTLPPTIILYRQPILLEWIETGADLYALVRSAVVHHVAQHFSFSNEEIDAIVSENS